jgi:aspartyl-tRNA(Asn)/glutamyl-tRNA(Gln) amidotransferase subunit B
MKLYPIIGIETHVQLNTVTKLFCSCLNEFAPDTPNKNICPFCTGQPGALPVLNAEAVKKAILFGVAIHANIPKKTRWDRKNYFYPDLPAGYQISQYDNPIVEGGVVEFFAEDKGTGEFTKHSVELTRAHLEADAGKLMHVNNKTLVDYNRAGCPLVEIVTEPVIEEAKVAMGYVTELQLLVRRLGISEANMDKGQMRFDCNLSMRTEEEYKLGKLPSYKVEVKNINSVRSLGRAIEFEIKRQTEMLENGETPSQETRGWRDDLNKSESQRSKEAADDYRYFPEPDLQILEIKTSDIPTFSELPELPMAQRTRYLELGLHIQIVNTLVGQPELAAYFDSAWEIIQTDYPTESLEIARNTANLISILIAFAEKLEKNSYDLVSSQSLVEIAKLFSDKKINNQGVQKLIEIIIENPAISVNDAASENSLFQLTDDKTLEVFVDVVIQSNPKIVEEYKSGKIQVIGFLIGQCMKESKGKGNPGKFKEILEVKL